MLWAQVITAVVAVYGAILSTYNALLRRKERRRLVRVELSMGLLATGPHLSRPMLILRASNPGNRTVTLTGPGVRLPNGAQAFFPVPESNVEFPYDLPEGKSCSVWTEASHFARDLRNHGLSGTVKLVGFYRDATGTAWKSKPMSQHVFHDLCLHIIWHTKDDQPLLRHELEQTLHRFLRRRCAETKGVFLHGIGGTQTHVHLALSVEPFVRISELIGDLKGASSREINREKGFKALYWQRGFGVVSFGRKNLPFVLQYIPNQKEHHARGTVHARLERTGRDRVPAREKVRQESTGGNG
jgi:putative transposase